MTTELAENEIREAFADITFKVPTARILSQATRRRHRRWVAMGALPVVVLMAAGGVAALTSKDLVITNVICYSAANLDDPQLGQVTPGNDGRSPEALCAEAWVLSHPGTNKSDVPTFTVCALDNGPVGVFPTDAKNFCSSPGLQPMPAGYMDLAKQFADMNRAMVWAIRDAAVKQGGSEEKACLDSTTAESVASQVMQDHGYEGWTVQSSPNPQGPCRMDVEFSGDEKIVTIYSTDPGIDNIAINNGSASGRYW